MVRVVDEVEDVGVAEDLLEQADLPLRVFPLAVEHVDGEGAAETLHLESNNHPVSGKYVPLFTH